MRRRVSDVMTTSVIDVKPSTSFKEIVALMGRYGVSALPVVDADRRPIGIISEADLLLKEEHRQDRRRPFERKHDRAEREKAAALFAESVMTSPVITITPDAPLSEAARMLHEHRIKRLPVVDGDGRLIGVVSRSDVLSVFSRPDEDIRAEITDEVLMRVLWVDPQLVTVSVERGVVRLEGRLESRSLAVIAAGIVQGIDGVVGVDNKLTWDFDDRHVRSESMGLLSVRR